MTADPTRIIDAFTFSNELDLLEVRLDLLADVVDRVVLVEATRTHSGLDKPLVFEDNKARFEHHLDRIEHVVVDDLPDPDPDRWVPENFQRNAILRGLHDLASDDLVLIGDVDEIPNPSAVQLLRDQCPDVVELQLRMAYFRANWEVDGQVWPLLHATRLGAMSTPQETRDGSPRFALKDAGAHLSYLMDDEQIITKLQSFAHDEFDGPRWKNPAFVAAATGTGLFAQGGSLLTPRGRDELNEAQRAVLSRFPRMGDFEPLPPQFVRRGLRRYSGLRRSPRLRDSWVTRTDTLALKAVTWSKKMTPTAGKET